ncbi:MAG: TonB-dependent receptor plug domain-containing protein, partial [Tannerella sp.]|nr:TonB-dependent receptor plug domain-containing protein [Tannerella sp.]
MKKIFILLRRRDTWRKTLCLLCILGCSFALHAQQKVNGTVVDDNGEAIIGANIVEAGTSNGTISDMNGAFTLTVAGPNVTLNVSYIGYQTVAFPLGGKGDVTIVLKEDLQNLDEIVVVGYGTARKRDLTGSVASVKNEKLKETASFSTIQALQGQAAGISVMRTNSTPGGSTSIRIRGNRSLKATNDPLYVVDGIPIVVGLDELSGSDIESIDILKDASATAIYGSRGANGVILITTKKGKAGRTQIDYNGY